jgi:hypothetical protein
MSAQKRVQPRNNAVNKRIVIKLIKSYPRFASSLKELFEKKEGMTKKRFDQAIQDISCNGFIVKPKIPKTFDEEVSALLTDANEAIFPYEQKGFLLYQSTDKVNQEIHKAWNSFDMSNS